MDWEIPRGAIGYVLLLYDMWRRRTIGMTLQMGAVRTSSP